MIKGLLTDFISLIYPTVCLVCGNSLFKHEKHVCNKCQAKLPISNFHKNIDNPINKLFIGRLDVAMAASYLIFTKAGSVQKLLHQLKYKGNSDLGVFLGYNYGLSIKDDDYFKNAEYIVPVPLHKSKLKKRGYNQSNCFAQGLANALNISSDETSLVRTKATETQTRKGKFERWQNVEDKFKITDFEKLKNKHVILVDDVVTTGATLEACGHVLKQIEGVKLSILAIAYANK